jgi:hypothetical protein
VADTTSTSVAPRARLVDRAKEAGLARHHRTWGASEIDYNRDGRPDLWIGMHFKGGRLWRNTGGGRYERVNTPAWPHRSRAGLPVDRHDCQWADVDRNGLPDAYCSAGRFDANFVKEGRDNELWLQGPKGTFRDVGTKWGVGDICGRGRTVAFIKANDDRFPDLFVGNDIPRRGPDPCNRHLDRYPNEHSKVLINTNGNGFRYQRGRFDYGPGPGSRCAETLDFDGDGWRDLLACGSKSVERRKSGSSPAVPLWLYRNIGGHRFERLAGGLPSVDVHDAVVGDLDGDRDPDVVIASNIGFLYSLNDEGRFTRAVRIARPRIGQPRAVAVGDVDRDGDLDVFGCIGGRSQPNFDDRLYLNDNLTFTAVAAPSARGTADEVIPVHIRAGAPTQFLVLNGYHGTAHPNIQLIALVR